MAAKKDVQMVRLTAPGGGIVAVSAEKAERLLGDSSWSKAPAKSAAKAKSTSDD